MDSIKKQAGLMGWWTSIVAVIIVGAFAYFFQDSFSGTSQAAISIEVPPQSFCYSNMLPVGSIYIGNEGLDEEFTFDGKRRGVRKYPFRSIQYALDYPVNPYYPAKRIVILGPEYILWDEDVPPHQLIIKPGDQVWIKGDGDQTKVDSKYIWPPLNPSLHFVNQGGQLLIENLWFYNTTLFVADTHGSPDRNVCKTNIYNNKFTATNIKTGEPRLVYAAQPWGTSSGVSLISSNIVELYDDPNEMTERVGVGGISAATGNVATVKVVNNTIIFPAYGATQKGGSEPRVYRGIYADTWDDGTVFIDKNTFITKEYDPEGEIEGPFGIVFSGEKSIFPSGNIFDIFQGTPFLIE